MPSWIGADEACALLGVQRATLYTYVSRGRVRTAPGSDGRSRRYHLGDLEELRQRARAHQGRTAVAAGALRWGEPVVDSAITSIDRDGPNYRGMPALALVERGVPFESVAELLWTESLPDRPPAWPEGDVPVEALTWMPPSAGPLEILAAALPALAFADPLRHGAPPDAELVRARRVLRSLVETVAWVRTRPEARAVREEPTLAGAVARALGDPGAVRQVDRALVLCADHELNASSFAARVAASTGADLYSCLGAALGALAGPLHGGACDRLEALIDGLGSRPALRAWFEERLRIGEPVPGFGHRLYPDGDPRAECLLEGLPAPDPWVGRWLGVGRDLGLPPPSVDLALVALGLPRGAATAVFALGRYAGWVAHILEQRSARELLRPRARYVGR